MQYGPTAHLMQAPLTCPSGASTGRSHAASRATGISGLADGHTLS